jgi:hypothetical protein
MLTIDHGRKSHTEMTKADVDRMGRQMAGAMAHLQEQLKNLPPADTVRSRARGRHARVQLARCGAQ